MRLFFRRSIAGPDSTPCVAGDDDVLRAVLEQQLGGLGDRAAGVDHVVDEDAGLAVDLADDLADLHLVRDVRVAALVDDRQAAAEAVGPALGDAHAARVRGDDDEVAVAPLRLDVVGEQRQREQVVDGPSKKPWICAVCRSTVMSRSAPAVLNMSAIRRALIGSRRGASCPGGRRGRRAARR
jgi:hypothetical protein